MPVDIDLKRGQNEYHNCYSLCNTEFVASKSDAKSAHNGSDKTPNVVLAPADKMVTGQWNKTRAPDV